MITFDERELKEIHHAIYYARNLAHGTVGHNVLMLLSKLAIDQGFQLGEYGDLFYGNRLAVEAFAKNI